MALFKRTQIDDDDGDGMVSLTDSSHAWWAEREELEEVFVPKKRGVPPVDAGRDPVTSEFNNRYSTESLFNWAASPEPDDPTHGGVGTPLDPYRVLGLQPGASLSEVVAAHRRLAKKFHPDQFHNEDETQRQDAAQRMSTVNAAYQELRSRLLAHRHTV